MVEIDNKAYLPTVPIYTDSWDTVWITGIAEEDGDSKVVFF